MTLQEIAKHLPSGAQTKIANMTGINKAHVSRFFSGIYNDRTGKILEAAKEILIKEKETQAKIEQTKKEIAELI